MRRRRSEAGLRVILLVYVILGIEYLWLRTDLGFLGEDFLHKLLGIGALFLTLHFCALRPSDIGFVQKNALRNTLWGLLLGASVYAIAYGVEFFLQYAAGDSPSFLLYVSSSSIDGNLGSETGLLFFAICILGNITNVVMEEGIFRGLFLKLAERKCSFFFAVLISSVLFGAWHFAAPLRSFLDGERSWAGTWPMMLMLFLVTGLAGVKFCLLTKISGSLWLPMADHFFSNTILTILHVATVSGGADAMQGMRIALAQTISTLVVLLFLWKGKGYREKTFR